jgi:hypothetical protein
MTDVFEDMMKIGGNLIDMGYHIDVKMKVNLGILCDQKSLVYKIASDIKG